MVATSATTTLSACSTPPASSTRSGSAGVDLPRYVPYDGVKSDLPSTADGVLPGFLAYPANPVRARQDTPATGGSVDALTLIYDAVPPPLNRNKYWQELNKRLGCELVLNMAPRGDYASRFTTTIAGGDVPDMALVYGTVPKLHAMLQSGFQDLSEFLSGDAAAQYPFLANIPTAAWKNSIYGGSIYGIPIPRSTVGSIMYIRNDLTRAKQLNGQPENFADFRTLCRELTDARTHRWALGRPNVALTFIQQMAGVPNQWREDGGKFISFLEVEETKQALADTVALIKDGVVHPDALGAPLTKVQQWLQSGTVAMNNTGYVAWGTTQLAEGKDPARDLGAIVPPGYSSGEGVHWEGPGFFGLLILKKNTKSRIEELLRICDWLSAPFGTEEYLFRRFGLANTHYKLEGSDPVPTDASISDTALPVRYLADAPDVLYHPGNPELTKVSHAFQQKLMPLAIPNAATGLVSETAVDQGAQLNKFVNELWNDIFAGRKSVSDWDAGVKHWRISGGDAMRAEYEKAFADING